MTGEGDRQWVVVGAITGAYGIKGWVKIHSYTDPDKNLFSYQPWYVLMKKGWCEVEIDAYKPHGKGFVAHIVGMDDRNRAEQICNRDICIRKEQIPPLNQSEFYWYQLQGLAVYTQNGQCLGVVDHLLETGANDVLVVSGAGTEAIDHRERLIPWRWQDTVLEVDLVAGHLVVDWEPDF
jgi:16S rRNA processing protein RimM